jgi:hypothetical protein
MKQIFNRIIAKLEDLSEYDDWGKIVDLDETVNAVYEVSHDYEGKYLTNKEYEELLEYKYMYENLCR